MNKIIKSHIESSNSVQKLNWLRATVLGANDAIVSISGLVMGVAGATDSKTAILTAGFAGIIAGAISMAAGEFVSVSSSKDSEKALLAKEHYELENNPEKELEELGLIYKNKGLSEKTAKMVAMELSKNDALAAHAHAELNIDPHNLTNPWQAAFASSLAFIAGSVIPLSAIIISPTNIRPYAVFISVIAALAITGYLSAKAGGANVKRAIIRVVIGGGIAMITTYQIGKLLPNLGI